jgi:hypothetical protein
MRFKAPLGKKTYTSLIPKGFRVDWKDGPELMMFKKNHVVRFEKMGKQIFIFRTSKSRYDFKTAIFLKKK